MELVSTSCIVLLLTFFFSGSSIVLASKVAFLQSRSSSHVLSAPFVVPRGGGLFGNNNKQDEANDKAVELSDESSLADNAALDMYPAMSKKEIEEWLEHVPVYAVTDPNGAGVVLKPENDTSVFYFFLDAAQANATLQQIKGMESMGEAELKVSAFSLGKIWFSLLNSSSDRKVVLKAPGADDEEASSSESSSSAVEYRLVPSTRDLLGARMMLTMTPEMNEKLKEAGGMTPEIAQEAIQKAMADTPKFKASFNEIPIFTIGQMRMQRKTESGSDDSESETLIPMYFSLQSMITTWQNFVNSSPDAQDLKDVEPAINLMSLHELVDLMQKDSPIDFRSMILIPSAPSGGAGAAAETTMEATASGVPSLDDAGTGGGTLGDL